MSERRVVWEINMFPSKPGSLSESVELEMRKLLDEYRYRLNLYQGLRMLSDDDL